MLRPTFPMLAVAILLQWTFPALAAAQAEHSTLILLMDASGSMKASDPGCVRAEAAELLLSLIPDGDRLAMASFGTSVVPITNGVEVLTGDSRSRASSRLRACAAADRYTDIGAALDYALALARSMPQGVRDGFPLQVVLFTDGKHDPAVGSQQTRASLDGTLKELKGLGTTVNTLGLGAGVDRELLQGLTNATGGQSVYSSSPSDLVSDFLIVARILGRRWLLDDRQIDSPVVLSVPDWTSDWRAVFLPGQAGARVSGDGISAGATTPLYQVFSGANQTRSVRISPSGPGRLLVDGSGALSLSTRFPQAVPSGAYFDCGATLVPTAGGNVAGAAFVEMAAVSVQVGTVSMPLYDDGRHQDGAAGDGDWGGRCRSDQAGRTVVAFQMATPSLAPPRATAEAETLERPIQVRGPSLPAALLNAALGRAVGLQVSNQSDVPLAGTLEIGGVSSTIDLPAHATVAPSMAVPYPISARTEAEVVFRVSDTRHEYSLGPLPIYPRAWLPGSVLALLTLLALSVVFPRRSSQGITLSVRGQPLSDDDDPFTQAGAIAPSGLPQFTGSLPEPFGRPGRFTGRSGLWRTGVTFVPDSWLVPKFIGRVPGTATTGFVLTKITTWEVTHHGYRVTYTLTPRH